MSEQAQTKTGLREIQEEDLESFLAWVFALPKGAIIGISCNTNKCPVAIWFTHIVQQVVSIEEDYHQYRLKGLRIPNPIWVRALVAEIDDYSVDITREIFFNYILPKAEWPTGMERPAVVQEYLQKVAGQR